MTRIKLALTFVLSTLIMAGFLTAKPSAAFAAPRLYFEPAATTVKKGSDFEVKVQIDVESQSAFGSDAVVNFPAADLNLVSVTSGGFFTDFAYANSTGQIEIHGYFSAIFDAKSGSGTLATLKFSAKKDSGTGALTFSCSGTQILNSSGDDILSCSSLNQSNITYTSASTGDTGSDTSGNNQAAGEPNSCGGTCGSNYNCKADLYCYQGFCRNPACATDTDCICPKTAANTKTTATPQPKAKSSPTPQAIALLKPTPRPAEQTPAPEAGKKSSLFIALEIAGIIAALGVSGYFLWRYWQKRKSSSDTPPTISHGI